MFRRYSVNFAILSMGVDAALVSLALYLATQLRPLLNELPFTEDIRGPLVIPGQLYWLFPVAWVALSLLLSVYDGRKNLRIVDEISSLSVASFLAGISLAGLLYLTYRGVSRVLFLVFALLAYLFLLSWRAVARMAFKLSKEKPAGWRRVLIVGAGPVGRELQGNIQLNAYLGYKLVGYLDDDPGKQVLHPDILGTLNDAREIIQEKTVDDIVIALPQRAYERVSYLVAELHDLAVKVWVIPDYFHLALHRATVEEFAGLPMLDLRAPALNDYQRMIKRVFDLTIGILSLPPALILMAGIAAAIWLETGLPIIFRQTRVGENGRLFEMYKFRTMVHEAEQLRYLVEKFDEHGNLIHKSADDPRVTRVGKFLRHTSLDELPQLFNLLKGEMSMVGPRPELPYLVERYEPWQRKRFAVPQGITGWWQISGRSDKPMHLHTEDDLFYIQNYSILLDIQILLKTVGVVLRRKGAF